MSVKIGIGEIVIEDDRQVLSQKSSGSSRQLEVS